MTLTRSIFVSKIILNGVSLRIHQCNLSTKSWS